MLVGLLALRDIHLQMKIRSISSQQKQQPTLQLIPIRIQVVMERSRLLLQFEISPMLQLVPITVLILHISD